MTSESKWSCREKLAIASYVLRSGELHWNNVSRLLKPLGEEGRSNDWFSSKHCAQKYSQMLDETEQPSRRKRGERSESSEGQIEMSKEEFLVKKLTQERIEELKRMMRIQKTKYRKLKLKMEQIESGELDDQLDEMIAEIEKPKTPPPSEPPAVTIETDDTRDDATVETHTDVPVPFVAEEAEQQQHEEEEEPKEEEICKEADNLNEKLQEEVEEVVEEESDNKISEEESSTDEPEVMKTEIKEEHEEEEVYVTIEEDKTKEEENTTINEELAGVTSSNADEEQLPSDNSQETDNTETIGISQSTIDKSSQETEVESTPIDHEEEDDKSVKSEEDSKGPEDEEVKNIDKSIQDQDDSLFVQSQSLPATPIPSNSSTTYESFPNSPALSYSSEMDHETTANYKAWRKSIMILWKQVASHRYASLFLQAVSDDIAPNYSSTIYRAMDLGTLKKNVENGMIRSTSEFQRDLMLMFQNALMYNNREHDVYKMANEMQHDVMDQVAQFLATQLMVEANIGGKTPANKTLRRSTMRRSILNSNEKASDDEHYIVASTAVLLSVLVGEARSKRVAAIEGEAKFKRKKPSHE